MNNALEKAAIAKNVADYIIDHLLVDEPKNSTELQSLAKDLAEDMKITDAKWLQDMTHIAIDNVRRDPRVKAEPEGLN